MQADHQLLRRLRRVESFDAAALLLLDRVLQISARTLESFTFDGGRVLRAMLHLRPHAGYSGLYVLEIGAGELGTPQGSPALLPSAGAWRAVESTMRPVSVDVIARSMQTTQGGRTSMPARGPRGVSPSSHGRLLNRGATHLYLVPILSGRRAVGMVSVEVACMDAAGHDSFIWKDCTKALELAVGLATPYLLALPRAESEALAGDALLPVVGPTMAPIVRVLRAFAAEDETLLLRGETGTGKSRLARWCHARSGRSQGPFVVLDLLSVPAETQMGELFGWKRGAFTGAVADHQGFVTRARHGTLFIDEVDKLSLEAQAGLLTLLEERRYRVLGDPGPPREAELRFIVGSNVDLLEAVRAGTFREDLYYRLNVLPMDLPPLRERADEIGAWANFMLERRLEEKGGRGRPELAEDALLELQRRRWPGNLREMDNVLRRAFTLASIEGDAIRIEARHLGGERLEAVEAGAVERLASGARALVGELMSGEALGDVELPGALFGFAAAAAVEATGSREAAFQLLGRGALVANRNHHKALKREVTRAGALCQLLGCAPPPELARLLEELS